MATIQWTSEQIEERERQKAANPPDRRISVEMTPKQKVAWRKAAEEEQARKDETIARHRKIMAAAEEPGFWGDLRRALNECGHRMMSLPDEIGVSGEMLDDFRAGEAELPADVTGRLIDTLNLRLMQEISSAVDRAQRGASAGAR